MAAKNHGLYSSQDLTKKNINVLFNLSSNKAAVQRTKFQL